MYGKEQWDIYSGRYASSICPSIHLANYPSINLFPYPSTNTSAVLCHPSHPPSYIHPSLYYASCTFSLSKLICSEIRSYIDSLPSTSSRRRPMSFTVSCSSCAMLRSSRCTSVECREVNSSIRRSSEVIPE